MFVELLGKIIKSEELLYLHYINFAKEDAIKMNTSTLYALREIPGYLSVPFFIVHNIYIDPQENHCDFHTYCMYLSPF